MSFEPKPRELVQVRGGQIRLLVAPVARYTRFVALSKHFLLLAILAAVGVVVWIASDNTGEGSGRLVFTGAQKNVSLINEMKSPHYQGVDAQNQPYSVTAKKAIQKDEHTVDMESLRADLMQNDGAWLALDAASGELNSTTKQLQLMGGVTVFYEGGYEFRSDHVHVDIDKGNADGDSPVEGQGPTGTIKANSFSLVNRGEIIRFNGSVITTLYPNQHE
ncbi:MAG: LPS export ABC transporter periplasmic protein LptC [Alphaproteobacteria bacterium]|nr:LPS export ABC transporter periplasmic protein LptC [Alphaproteobacteria bacterium]